MSRRSLGSGALCVLLILIVGCGGDDGGGTKPCVGTPGNPIAFPLETGNQWTYTRTRTEDGTTTSAERVDEVTGVRDFKTDSYAVVRTAIDDGVAEPDTVEQYYAQRGQELFLYQPFDTSDVSSEITREIYTALIDSQPWKVADFTSTECDSWELLDFSGQWTTSEGELTVGVKLRASNEGRTSVTVPAGTYSDVYIGKFETVITQKLRNPFTGFSYEQTETQRMFIKDGIGVVKERAEIKAVLDDGEELTEDSIEIESNLRSTNLKR